MKTTLEGLVSEMLDNGLSLRNIQRAVDTVVVRQALERTKWNQCKACLKLGVHRNTLFRHMQELRIERPRKKATRMHAGISAEIRERVWGRDQRA